MSNASANSAQTHRRERAGKRNSGTQAPQRVPASETGVVELATNIAVGREQLRHAIAEAAYYRAERRGFAPGHELEDWLAAQAEVLAG